MLLNKITSFSVILFLSFRFSISMSPQFTSTAYDKQNDTIMTISSDHELFIAYGTYSKKGLARSEMEDAHFPNYNNIPLIADKTLFFGVYDGHGGSTAANFAADYLHENIVQSQSFPSNIRAALKAGYVSTDSQYVSTWTSHAGTTAVTALVYEKKLWIANVGDAEAVGYFNGENAQCLTQLHAPGTPEELDRIRNIANHQVKIFRENQIIFYDNDQVYRLNQKPQNIIQQTNKFLVSYELDGSEKYIYKFNNISRITINMGSKNGSLAVSRAIGDQHFKPYCIATPFIQSFDITQPGFFILACDGLWDVMSYQAAVNIVLRQLILRGLTIESVTTQAAHEIARVLVKKSIKIWDHDNVTASIIFFNPRHD